MTLDSAIIRQIKHIDNFWALSRSDQLIKGHRRSNYEYQAGANNIDLFVTLTVLKKHDYFFLLECLIVIIKMID